MRVAALLLVWFGLAAPALAQQCDVSAPAGDVFRSATETGAPAIGWDVKRQDGVGHESDHFARPQLSLTFAVDEGGKLSGPSRALVMVTTYSDRDVGDAPPMRAVRFRVRGDDTMLGEWGESDPSAEILLAKWLRAQWPGTLVVDVVGPDGQVEASSTFDLSLRLDVEDTAVGMRKACFR